MPQGGGRLLRARTRSALSRRARSPRCFHCAQRARRARRSLADRVGTPVLAVLAIAMGVAVFSTAGPGTLAGGLGGGQARSATLADPTPLPLSAGSSGTAPPVTTLAVPPSGPAGGAPAPVQSAPPTTVAAAAAAGSVASPADPPAPSAHGQSAVPTTTVPGAVPMASPTTQEPCSIGPRLVPSCGVLTGLYSDAPGGVPARQAQVGHAFNLVQVVKTSFTDAFPTASDLNTLGSDTALFVAWDTYAHSGRGRVRWQDIAAGAWDGTIDAEAGRLAAYGHPIMVSLMPEMELANRNGAFGTAGDFVAAYREIVTRMRADGATNVVWVWEMGGEPASNAVAYYPGNDVVDWIAWDPYNGGNCPRYPSGWHTFTQITEANYAYFTTTAPYRDKPLMLGEFGTVEQPGNAAGKGGWLSSVPSQASAEPLLKALVYFDSTSGCDWAVDSTAAALQGFESMTTAGY
jgi:hypothetical protein